MKKLSSWLIMCTLLVGTSAVHGQGSGASPPPGTSMPLADRLVPEQAPTPTPIENGASADMIPSLVPDPQGAVGYVMSSCLRPFCCRRHSCRWRCGYRRCHRLTNWLCYRPARTPCCCKPPLYTYFLDDCLGCQGTCGRGSVVTAQQATSLAYAPTVSGQLVPVEYQVQAPVVPIQVVPAQYEVQGGIIPGGVVPVGHEIPVQAYSGMPTVAIPMPATVVQELPMAEPRRAVGVLPALSSYFNRMRSNEEKTFSRQILPP